MLNEHDSGRRDNSAWLFSLLVLALWFEDVSQARPAALVWSASRPTLVVFATAAREPAQPPEPITPQRRYHGDG